MVPGVDDDRAGTQQALGRELGNKGACHLRLQAGQGGITAGGRSAG